MKIRSTLAWATLAVATMAVALAGVGAGLVRPAHRPVGAPPSGLPAEPIDLSAPGDLPLRGWRIDAAPGGGAVLLLHGIHADRRAMLGRAWFLHRLGCSVVMIDLPGHGESGGDRITFGAHEAEAATAALAYLRRVYPHENHGAIGVSLGAAALVLARPSPAPDALVLESMFPTIEEAIANRLAVRFGEPGRWLTPLLLWQLPWQIGATQQDLSPAAALPGLRAPLLIVSGTDDPLTTAAETQRLHAIAEAPKALWLIDGAAHVDLHTYAGPAYEARVGAFLRQHLRDALTSR